MSDFPLDDYVGQIIHNNDITVVYTEMFNFYFLSVKFILTLFIMCFICFLSVE